MSKKPKNIDEIKAKISSAEIQIKEADEKIERIRQKK